MNNTIITSDDISAQLHGLSCLVCIMANGYTGDLEISNDTTHNALFALECYLEKLARETEEIPILYKA